MFPIATLQDCHLDEANALLVAWHHKMGALERPMHGDGAYVLLHEHRPVAVATHSTAIRETVGGGCEWLHRESGIELSRLCAARPNLCRVMLRLWREFVFPTLPYEFAFSYQDADLHNGNTYRFDGWVKLPRLSRSGTDPRSGRTGRNKWVWVWPADRARALIAEAAA